MVIRPKSMATVVARFCSIPARSSTPRPATVRGSSVRSGAISLTDPTMVVLPTPKPPAMRILTVSGAVGAPAVSVASGSEPAKAFPHFLQQVQVRGAGRDGTWRMRGDEARLQQIAEHDHDHADREVEQRGQLRHGDGAGAPAQDAGLLGLRAGGEFRWRIHRGDRRDEGEIGTAGPRP